MEEEAIRILLTYEYEVFDQIGEGAYGKCFLVKSQKYNEEFACKYVNLNNVAEQKRQSLIDSFEKEYNILKNLENKYIIYIFDYIHDTQYLFLILQLCNNGSLKTLRNSVDCLLKSDIYKYITEMTRALTYLHSQNYAHHDIKPSNFLLDSNNQINLADFGITSKYSKDEFSSYRGGTLAFMAPEIFGDKEYDPFKADVWAFAVTSYYLITGYVPWAANDPNEFRKLQFTGLYFPSTVTFPKTIRKLIIKCLNINPSERPTFVEIQKILGKKTEYVSQTSNLPPLNRKGTFKVGSVARFPMVPIARPRAGSRPRLFSSKSLNGSIGNFFA